ncbi:hypothetical protein [Treponema brennaborense]|uniref:Lipoprotein n=1 Tax=Treponema brennaborense (strain DSM 12168 / CIP 105900 / DD5/3) TaxID=906968 RepID=F4LL03_TREBD|nr:hypothetical protein [Treponema brennaborense]AEE16600.1 hypothetical protein Trebr_1172 [Treponema brennaborense DSM 12168]
MDRFFFWYAALCFCIVSCSNPQNGAFAGIDDGETVKSSVTEAASAVRWTPELEARNSAEIKAAAGTGFKMPALSSVESALLRPSGVPVYPAVAGFGSLDTSSVPAELREMLVSFCSGVRSYRNETASAEPLYAYMGAGRAYLLTVFLYDVSRVPLLTRYVLGKPFDVDSFRQIPVRFYADNGYIDLHAYVAQSDSRWYIDQITYGAFVYE